MRSLNVLQWAGALVLAISLSPGRVVAQDTLSITGTFKMNELYGAVGDLAGVQPNAADRWWKLTLHGVSYSRHFSFWTDGMAGFWDVQSTRVHATSFTFEFFGSDAAILNEVVSSRLTRGSLADGAFLELSDAIDQWGGHLGYGFWSVGLYPSETATFVDFGISDDWVVPEFAYDELGYPLVQPQRLYGGNSTIRDYRPGNAGALLSYSDIVDIDSDQQPILPPPQVAIRDASTPEGNRGTTSLLIAVSLNSATNQVVTVSFQTADGTAVAGTDYVAASGTVTFQPGETSKTIAISIKGDRKREANETFTVHLSNAIGATISDGVGTATILNDD
jgi:hypothetical protein